MPDFTGENRNCGFIKMLEVASANVREFDIESPDTKYCILESLCDKQTDTPTLKYFTFCNQELIAAKDP